jgi:hypothetical protein
VQSLDAVSQLLEIEMTLGMQFPLLEHSGAYIDGLSQLHLAARKPPLSLEEWRKMAAQWDSRKREKTI